MTGSTVGLTAALVLISCGVASILKSSLIVSKFGIISGATTDLVILGITLEVVLGVSLTTALGALIVTSGKLPALISDTP
jgi:hypothetical protein